METAQSRKQPIGMIVGPTASGKTTMSIELAQRLGAEIISADSIQIYKGLDVGSAKPSVSEMKGIPHHLLDVVEFDERSFSVAEYQRLAFSAIDDIAARGKFPLVVGGTGLYINALCYPLNFTSVPSDKEFRFALEKEEADSPGSLYARLSEVDKVTADRLHPNDKKRIIRALEVYELTGKPLSEHGNDFSNCAEEPIPYEPRIIGVMLPRETLYARIELRVDQMMERGLLQEVEALKENGADAGCPAMQGLGYKQLSAYLDGQCRLDEAVEQIKRDTRHFAKRQMTWFRRDKRIHWLDCSAEHYMQALERAQRILEGMED